MPDLRDALFGRIHADLLKPSGFRKTGRTSKREVEGGLRQLVVLESAPRAPFDPLQFDIELRATHVELPQNRLLMGIGLCSYTSGKQRWVVSLEAASGEAQAIEQVFRTVGIPLLQRMSTLEGLVSLFEDLKSVWFYEGYAWCLERLGRSEQAIEVVKWAIENAPHEDFRLHAERALHERLERFSGA